MAAESMDNHEDIGEIDQWQNYGVTPELADELDADLWAVFCQANPHEAYAEDPGAFLEYVREQTDKTDAEIVAALEASSKNPTHGGDR